MKQPPEAGLDRLTPSDEDPLETLRGRLQALHRARGEPSLRAISKGSNGAVSHSTVGLILKCANLPNWPPLEVVVGQLGGDTEEFRQLWVAVRDAQAPLAKKAIDPASTGELSPAGDTSAQLRQTTDSQVQNLGRAHVLRETHWNVTENRPTAIALGIVVACTLAIGGYFLAKADSNRQPNSARGNSTEHGPGSVAPSPTESAYILHACKLIDLNIAKSITGTPDLSEADQLDSTSPLFGSTTQLPEVTSDTSCTWAGRASPKCRISVRLVSVADATEAKLSVDRFVATMLPHGNGAEGLSDVGQQAEFSYLWFVARKGSRIVFLGLTPPCGKHDAFLALSKSAAFLAFS